TGIVQTTTYSQQFPYVGLVTEQTKTLSSVTLNDLTQTLAQMNSQTGVSSCGTGVPCFPYAQTTTAASKDLDNSSLPTVTTTYTYDPSGNPTQTVAKTPDDNAKKTTTNPYDNDPTPWLLGRLRSASVASVFNHTASGAENQAPTAVNDSKTTHAG